MIRHRNNKALDRLKYAYETACSTFSTDKKFNKPFYHMVRRCEELLYDCPVDGLNIIDVGAGNGFLSHYLVECAGANSVEAVDNYEGKGSPSYAISIIKKMQEVLGNSEHVKIIKSDFMKYTPKNKSNCVIFLNVLHHIINHIKKELGVETSKAVETVLKHAAECLQEGGKLIFQEFMNHNYYLLPFYRNFVNSVDYKSKIPFEIWEPTLKKIGFINVKVRYRLPLFFSTRSDLRYLFNNRIASLLTDSSFVMLAIRA